MSGLISTQSYVVFTSSDDGLVPSSPGGSDDFLRADAAWEIPPSPEPGDPAGVFGNGAQGSVVFDGSSVVLGLTPSGNVYTLTSCILVENMTVDNGVAVVTAGFRIFVSGTLTCNGTIHNNGQNASGQTAGAVTHGTAFFGSGTQGGNGGAVSTGNGGTSTTRIPSVEWSVLSAVAGGDGTGVLANGTPGGKGQGGGGGGAGISNNGGIGGALSSGVVTVGAAWPNALLRGVTDTGLTEKWSYASGGGGGAGAGAAGGGGGGGAGMCCVCARYLTGTGTISANGGAGAQGPTTGAGGGGGGGGGVALVFYGNRTGSLTITANGGTPGSGHATPGPNGLGGSGGAGGNGSVILVNTSGDGT